MTTTHQKTLASMCDSEDDFEQLCEQLAQLVMKIIAIQKKAERRLSQDNKTQFDKEECHVK